VHSEPSDLVLDFFAGSGTTGEAAARLGRRYLLVDSNPEAVRVMARRLAWDRPEVSGFEADSREANGLEVDDPEVDDPEVDGGEGIAVDDERSDRPRDK